MSVTTSEKFCDLFLSFESYFSEAKSVIKMPWFWQDLSEIHLQNLGAHIVESHSSLTTKSK